MLDKFFFLFRACFLFLTHFFRIDFFYALIHETKNNMLVIFFRFRSRVVHFIFIFFVLSRASNNTNTLKILNVTQFGLIMCQVACSQGGEMWVCVCIKNGKYVVHLEISLIWSGCFFFRCYVITLVIEKVYISCVKHNSIIRWACYREFVLTKWNWKLFYFWENSFSGRAIYWGLRAFRNFRLQNFT